MNLLILSAGTRDKVVQYFKKELGDRGRVIATDCSNLAPAVYEADAFYLVPRITAPDYLDVILDICRKEKITGVFSLIDPELSLLAKEREKFLALSVKERAEMGRRGREKMEREFDRRLVTGEYMDEVHRIQKGAE